VGAGASEGFPFKGAVVTLDGAREKDLVTLKTAAGDLPVVSQVTRQVSYIAWPLGRDYYQTGYPEWRSFLKTALGSLGLDAPYEIQGPANLDANLMERKSELLLHLVNAPIQRGLPGMMPYVWNLASIEDVRVSVRCPRPQEVTLEPDGRALKFSYEGASVHFTVPEVRIYEIVRIKY
jgi:hypothetical protein